MTYALAALGALALVVVTIACVIAFAWRGRTPRAPARPPAPAPLDRSEMASRLGEVEAGLAALRQRLEASEGHAGLQFRRLWGAVSVERRADRQGQGDAGQLVLPALSDEEGTRPLTPELLAQLTGQGAAIVPSEAAPTMKPPARRRTWGR